jgi:hypothetical protein
MDCSGSVLIQNVLGFYQLLHYLNSKLRCEIIIKVVTQLNDIDLYRIYIPTILSRVETYIGINYKYLIDLSNYL